MSSPNEPGQQGPGQGLGAGSGAVEPPPWQRGGPRPRTEPVRPGATGPERAGGGAAAPDNGIEARVNRFITGGAASEQPAAPPAPPSAPPPPPPVPSPAPPAPVPPARQEFAAPPPRPEVPRPEVARPEPRPESRVERTEISRPQAYSSELPKLPAEAPPLSPPRNPAVEKPNSGPPNAGAPRTQVGTRPSAVGGPVRATMQIRHIDPWSTLKVSLLLSVALFFVWMIAVALLYLVLGGMGVWSKLNSNVGDLLTSTSGGGGELVSSGTIFGGAALIGLVNIVLLTAMATIGAFVYNLSTDVVGGVEVTLADRD